MQTNNAHEYTDEQLQAAIDAAFPSGSVGLLSCDPLSNSFEQEKKRRLAIARAFLAALPKPKPEAVAADEGAPATSDPYARLKSYAAAGARIRCTTYGDGWTDWELKKHAAWRWCKPVDQYEVHPDDLHLCPEYAPKSWTLPAPPPGRRWHREDWTADMLPEGWRPHLLNEDDAPGDQRLNSQGIWEDLTGAEVGPTLECHRQRRTRRPLPAKASAEPEEAEVGINGLTDAQTQATASVSGLSKPADNSPPWQPHDGGPCPLKDEEVEEWEWKLRSGYVSGVQKAIIFLPSERVWDHDGAPCNIIAYRVLKWKPGHGPQAVSKADEPATFEAHGKTWTRHTPGDPCPCDPSALVYVAFKDGTFSSCPDFAEVWGWGTVLTENEWIIGWRYADEPAKPTQSQQAWTPKPGDVVRLKSGGPRMTVFYVNDGDKVKTTWFDGATPVEAAFPTACLTPAKEGQP